MSSAAETDYRTIWDTLSLDETAAPEASLCRIGESHGPVSDRARGDRARGDGLQRAIAELPQIEADGDELSIIETIGEGGMGVVRLARQKALFRHVAVKTVRPEKLRRSSGDASWSAGALLREAWVTGALEHPNIVPVYAVGRGESGEPVIVMKRIEGISWRQVLRGLRTEDDSAGTELESGLADNIEDELEWHLDVLDAVCNALSYAHSRGILHRDLKPANVMIGEFGEIYLLDWGIAVAFDDEDGAVLDPGAANSILPLASECTRVEGTPAYLPPEMAAPGTLTMDQRTDVFLLGAALYEIITGSTPNRGDNLYKVMEMAWRCPPRPFPDDAPSELVAVCRRAMEADPDERFSSVDAFQRALREFRKHRSSVELARQAGESLEALEQVARVQDNASESTHDQDTEEAVEQRFAECRFGFQLALETWPENPRALEGLRRATELMARYALGTGNLRAARVHVGNLDTPGPDLLDGLKALQNSKVADQERRAELEKIAHDQDVDVSPRSKVRLAAGLGLVWVVLPFTLAILQRLGIYTVTSDRLMLSVALFAAVVLGGIWFGRKGLMLNAVNRQIIAILAATIGGLFLHRLGGLVLQIPQRQLMILDITVFFMASAALAIAVDRRTAPAAVTYGLAALIAPIHPGWILELLGVANLIAFGTITWAWIPGSRAGRICCVTNPAE